MPPTNNTITHPNDTSHRITLRMAPSSAARRTVPHHEHTSYRQIFAVLRGSKPAPRVPAGAGSAGARTGDTVQPIEQDLRRQLPHSPHGDGHCGQGDSGAGCEGYVIVAHDGHILRDSHAVRNQPLDEPHGLAIGGHENGTRPVRHGQIPVGRVHTVFEHGRRRAQVPLGRQLDTRVRQYLPDTEDALLDGGVLWLVRPDQPDAPVVAGEQVLCDEASSFHVIRGHVVPLIPAARHQHHWRPSGACGGEMLESARSRGNDDTANPKLLELLNVPSLLVGLPTRLADHHKKAALGRDALHGTKHGNEERIREFQDDDPDGGGAVLYEATGKEIGDVTELGGRGQDPFPCRLSHHAARA
jgi:hypothetical protein